MKTLFIPLVAAALSVAVNAQIEESAAAQSTAPPVYALFQYSNITSTWNTINVTRVPVSINGQLTYQDMTLIFSADSTGKLTIAPGYPQTTLAPPLLVAQFKPGTYAAPSNVMNGAGLIVLSGPGPVSGGATQWSIATPAGAYAYTYPSSATFYVGPITSSPFAARIQQAGISAAMEQQGWYFGVGGAGTGTTVDGGAWYSPNALLAFSQTGNALTILSFTDSTGKDNPNSVGQVTYTLTNP